jgi:hypothetical protein
VEIEAQSLYTFQRDGGILRDSAVQAVPVGAIILLESGQQFSEFPQQANTRKVAVSCPITLEGGETHSLASNLVGMCQHPLQKRKVPARLSGAAQ